MHPILDDFASLTAFDFQKVLSSITELPKQCLDAHQKASLVEIPAGYANVSALVMCGMGGSGLGARVIESVYGNSLKFPLVRINDYDLPAWVDSESLVICSSYSGTTEETIQNLQEAISRKAKILVISSGGDLIKLAVQNNIPYYQIDPVHNPSNQPRMALGYSIFGQLAMISKIGLVPDLQNDLQICIQAMKSVITANQESIPTAQNPAKSLAIKMENKLILLITSNSLHGAVHIIKNQFNENAKHFCDLFDIPELNHHLMEGLRFPSLNSQDLYAVMINSALFPSKINKRLKLTQEIIEKNHIETGVYQPVSPNLLSQTFEVLQYGSYLVYYLVALHQLDPAPIPWVDYFKAKLNEA